jgi:hypothetical protein
MVEMWVMTCDIGFSAGLLGRPLKGVVRPGRPHQTSGQIRDRAFVGEDRNLLFSPASMSNRETRWRTLRMKDESHKWWARHGRDSWRDLARRNCGGRSPSEHSARAQDKIISFIEDIALIKKILMHLGLWETRPVGRSARRVDSNHDPPQCDNLHIPTIETELTYDYTYSWPAQP